MYPLKRATPAYSSCTADKSIVRLPEGIHKQIAEVVRSHHHSMDSEIIARLEQSLPQEGALQDNLGVRLDSPGLSLHKRELPRRFCQPTRHQQDVLITLIAHDTELTQA